MDKSDYLAALRADAGRLAAAGRLGLVAPVPSCPGWSVVDLLVHTGGVHRAQANIVAMRAQEPLGMNREMFESVPGLLPWLESSVLLGGESDLTAIPPGLVDWFEEGGAVLVDTLAAADPDEPVWSWSGNNRVAHYLRMMPIETAVHRWDAQLAHGCEEPIDQPLALDGIAQTFEVMMPFRRNRQNAPSGRGETYCFRATDSPDTWLVRFDGEPTVSHHTDERAGVTISGPASDLFLFLWHRLDRGALSIKGDEALISRYFELVPPI